MPYREKFQLKETIVTIIADYSSSIEIAKDTIKLHRSKLERYIESDPYFNTTLESYDHKEKTPEIVQRLISASKTMGIGPMSAVAGTIASLAVEAMKDAGENFAIVDNGGDIALINNRPATIGIYAGSSAFKNLAFKMEPRNTITGVCTSSGTVGPSISFGMADAAIVFSDNVSLADSAATELGNAVTDVGREFVENSFGVVENIPGIKGAVVIQGEHMGFWGEVPEMIHANIDYDCITKG
ncbi:ApbE family lipoprotein [Methanohalobium evestigatum Z-7303]|uniref:UPF0280 protein Metev_1057 n=1 Tax=Methanohalobium evestigatum (strain ATCC BAA-1072 / DSM 3721 / NBRC 107634 / OCM 161 / Z-7303) TaxID=644295 RepID=D7E8Z5_METEZ|nr:UPF0280 family protein [Methanohalobium evestigatum]ADI73943.1 ApbE family lipoprotein [Methanohalobium evestigatum Z-7303]